MTAPPPSEGVIALAVALAPVLAVIFGVVNGRVQRLSGAFYLVLWGLFIAVVEHAGFGQPQFGGFRLSTHEGFHFQMLAAYGLAAFALTGAVVGPLIRRGDRAGWYGLLILVVIGAGSEALTAAVTTPHGLAPRWWSWGLALWGYPIAWVTALVLARRPIFTPNDTDR